MINKMITERPVRLLYLPNETKIGEFLGVRTVFETMLKTGELGGYETFSFLVEQKNRGSNTAALDALLSLAKHFQPDIILWQRPGVFIIPTGYGLELKSLDSQPVLVYEERDLWGGRLKHFTESMCTLASEADILFLVGLGAFADKFRKLGAKNIFHDPNSVDTLRFGKPWTPTMKRKYDVIMIANLFKPKGFKPGLPGWKGRWHVGKRLNDLLGKRFAIYGTGWDELPSAKGNLPFLKSEEACRDSWLTVGWNYYDQTPFYFSNRLPMALLSGVAHVTNYQPGYEIMFENGKNLCYAHTVGEMVDIVTHLLSLPRDRIIEIGLEGQEYAKNNLSHEIGFKNIIRISSEFFSDTRSK